MDSVNLFELASQQAKWATVRQKVVANNIALDWSFGVEQEPIALTSPEDTVVFQYPNGGHNVYKFADEAHFNDCDFADATLICDQDVTECTIDAASVMQQPGETLPYSI